MIILSILCILIGVCGIGYAAWTKFQCVKLDQNIISQNSELEQRNADLQEENQALWQENADNENLKEIILQELKEISEKRKKQTEQLNQLLQQKQIINTEIEMKKAQIGDLQQNIEIMSGDLKAAARASFEQYCETLDYEYKKREQEFEIEVDTLDQLYFDRLLALDARERGLIEERRQDIDILVKLFYDKQQSMSKELQEEEAAMRADLDSIRKELEKIRATKAAAMEAQLREEEIKNQATFYTLQLNEADKRDVAYLQSIEYNLREARPLRMLIWSTFYRDKVNDLAARVGAVGASGIYKITHIDSGISYIGQAKDIKERWVSHVKCSLGIDTPVTSQLYAFTREKGIDNFTFEVLEKCNINELNEKEKFYIDLYQTYDFGLNKTRGNS